MATDPCYGPASGDPGKPCITAVNAPPATPSHAMRKYFWIPLLLAVAAYVLLPLPGQSKPSLSKRIEGKRAQVQKAKAKEGVLTKDIVAYNNRISGLQGQISGTQKRLSVVQDDLDGARNELLTVRDKLEVARDRLVRARAELKQARGGLEDRLVELYKADQPDALTVVLEADGFNDLLERTDFLERISDQDGAVIRKVRVLKARAEKRRAPAGRPGAQAPGGGRDHPAPARRHRRHPRPPGHRPGRPAQRPQRAPERPGQGRRTTAATPRRTWPRWRREQSKIRSQLAGGPSVTPGRSSTARAG